MYPNLTVYDSRAPLELFAKNGFYQVGTRAFNYKVTALQEATRTNSVVKWMFNDHIFSTFDWTTSNHLPLSEMYRLRAQQLRDKYNYLMLGWSGGADSTTILDTFLDNNIRLDEVVITWALTASQGRYTPSLSLNDTNMASEWDFAIKPKLDAIRAQYPNLKITIRDMKFDANHKEYAEDSVLLTDKHSYFGLTRIRDLDQLLEQRSNQYHSIAYVTGVSPPDLFFIDNRVYTSFPDTHTTPTAKSDLLAGWIRNIEFFYWTPDMPELVREQCHTLLRVLNTDRSFRRHFKRKDQQKRTLHWPDYDLLRYVRKPYLYPNYPQNTFQVGKPKLLVNYNSWYSWFYDNPHSAEFTAPLDSAINTNLALIHPRFLVHADDLGYPELAKRSAVVDYKPIDSRAYYIGDLVPLD
jgi:hypothetical protein